MPEDALDLVEDSKYGLQTAFEQVGDAKQAVARLAAHGHTLWCATVGGLLIGLEEHIKVVRDAVAAHPTDWPTPQIQPEGIENHGQDRET